MPAREETNTIKAKVKLLNAEAWDNRVSDSIKAMELSREALELARQIGDQQGTADALSLLGFTHIRVAKNEEAMAYLNEALPMFETLKDPKGLARTTEYFGIIFRNRGDYEKSLQYLYRGLEICLRDEYLEGESLSYYHIGVTYRYLGNLEKALENLLKSLAIARSIQSWVGESYSLNIIGSIYFEMNDLQQALDYFQQGLVLRHQSGDQWGEAGSLDNIGHIYFKLGDFPLALDYCRKSLEMTRAVGDKKGEGNSMFHLAEIYHAQNELGMSMTTAKECLEMRDELGDRKGRAEVLLFLADISVDTTEKFKYLQIALELGRETGAQDILARIHSALYILYKSTGETPKALEHFETSQALEREVHSRAIQQRMLSLEIEHRVEKSRQEAEIYRLKSVELSALYEEIKLQKEEIERTQQQLILREKMASLGELTAGIAHEIKNPLNFINNFADLNDELICDLENCLKSGDYAEALRIAASLKENEKKIVQHGSRADGIVKGMLQHSRGTTGEKEAVDINTLCDEYLRLSYFGIRSQNGNFKVNLETNYDVRIKRINLVPQDIGRVLLNLFNNAFYAVNEKFRNSNGQYYPEVAVVTSAEGDRIRISVQDNGGGIPAEIRDKIFQPFFTTKPTGQGTGLGLSLSYDIITKGHHGELRLEDSENGFTEFTILLPINSKEFNET